MEIDDIKEKIGAKANNIKCDVEVKAEELKLVAADKAEELKHAAVDKAGELKHAAIDKAEELKHVATDKAEELKEITVEKVEEINFNTSDLSRDAFMLKGALAEEGYDWWWHSFTGINEKTGKEKAFFIEFFAINPALGGPEPILGQLPQNIDEGNKPSYMMVKCGAWGENPVQLHRFFGWDNVTIKEDIPYHISSGECFCSETRTMGKVDISEEDAASHPEWMCDAGKMLWDLKIDKKVAFNVGYGAGKALRDVDAFEMFWHAEGMKTAFEGTVYFNGEKYIVKPDTCYGYADKNWGKDFTSPWVWLSSNNLTSNITGEKLNNSVFDIGGGRPKVGPVALGRKLLGAFWYEGTPYEFNFSKVWTLAKTRFACKDNDEKVVWRVEQETPTAKMQTQITCFKKDMLLVNYEAPNGEKKHKKLWNGGTGFGNIKLYKKKMPYLTGDEWELIDDIDVKNAGCEYGEYEED